MAKKLLSTLLMATFLLLSVGSAVASSTIDRAEGTKDKAQQEIDKLEEELEKLQNQQAGLIGEMDEYEAQIVELMATVEIIEGQVADKEAELEQVQADLEVAKAKEQKQYEDMKLRIQYMYEKGDTAFIEAILGATSMDDLLNQVEYYDEVYSYDRKLLTTYKETKLATEQLQAQVETELEELSALQESCEAEKKTMEAALEKIAAEVDNYEAMMANAQQKVSDYEKVVAAQNAIIAQEQERIRKEEEERKKNENNNGGSSDTSKDPGYSTNVSPQELIDYAMQFVGKPYVWGGTDPNTGADCSGFIQYVYKHFGIRIPRTSLLQRTCGREVSYENAQMGDIICYDGHVALYLGNNRILHAKGRDYGIVVDNNAKYKKILTIRRVL